MLVAVLVARRWARSRLRQLLHPAHHRRGSNVDEDAVPLAEQQRSSQRVFDSAENGRIGVCGTLLENGTRSLSLVSGC